jgi:hypothetical protein
METQLDATATNPKKYRTIFENDRVRVLEYADEPGDTTDAHQHPDSVMVTLSSFKRRIFVDGHAEDVELGPGQIRWLDAQEHHDENIGDTSTRSIMVELKEPRPQAVAAGVS